MSWFFAVGRQNIGALASAPGEGDGTPLQYSCLENPMDRGTWWAAVHGVSKSWTWLSDFTFTFHFHALEKEMATHSSTLVCRIPGMGEPGGLMSMGSHRVRHDWSDLAAASASVLQMDIQGWFPLGLTGLISVQSKGFSTVFCSTTLQKHQFFGTQPSLWSNSHICNMTTGKSTALAIWTFVGKVMSLLFSRLSRFLKVFFPRSKYLLTSWL